MFDAKNLLDMMVRGAGQSAPARGGGLADILGQVLQGGRGNPSGASAQAPAGSMGGLEDLLRSMVPPAQTDRTSGQPAAGGISGLEDLLRGLFPEQTGSGQAPMPPMPQQRQALPGDAGRAQQPDPAGQGGGLGNLADLLRNVLAQATDGVKEGAGRIGQSAGARDIIGQMTGGRTPEELMSQLRDLIARNQLGAGAALGGLGALVLGTQTGRSIAVGAAKLGALALIGGLAYKAYQNYADGRPLITGRDEMPEAAPPGSGFEQDAVSQEAAMSYIRAMIAAAASDGRLDAAEQSRIVGSLRNAGLDAQAEEFLAAEINNPATIEDLVAGVRSKQEAVQLYTAARIAIEPDTGGEQAFLAALASQLGLDRDLAAHIDATARSTA